MDDITTTRQYTISCAPNKKFFRLTIKMQGIVSNWLLSRKVGDKLNISVPTGEFVLKPELENCRTRRPACFISGGVGLTPLLSMITSILEAGCDVSCFHDCCESNLLSRCTQEQEGRSHAQALCGFILQVLESECQVYLRRGARQQVSQGIDDLLLMN